MYQLGSHVGMNTALSEQKKRVYFIHSKEKSIAQQRMFAYALKKRSGL
jgi:hypothetical protein